mmetsp:Transcript_58164/g.133118  ORF Transcript_58164/g.133118 Transcript_58164/m.133118 type:complete len:205 (+) Transcript_58164:378-992(+)
MTLPLRPLVLWIGAGLISELTSILRTVRSCFRDIFLTVFVPTTWTVELLRMFSSFRFLRSSSLVFLSRFSWTRSSTFFFSLSWMFFRACFSFILASHPFLISLLLTTMADERLKSSFHARPETGTPFTPPPCFAEIYAPSSISASPYGRSVGLGYETTGFWNLPPPGCWNPLSASACAVVLSSTSFSAEQTASPFLPVFLVKLP